MIVCYIITSFVHNGVDWKIVRIGESFFARCVDSETGVESDTGPYATIEEAEEFITAIQP